MRIYNKRRLYKHVEHWGFHKRRENGNCDTELEKLRYEIRYIHPECLLHGKTWKTWHSQRILLYLEK